MNEVSKNHSSLFRRITIGAAGGIVVLLGIVAIPYPGPGWLIVFAGLGILSTEFEWAKRLLKYLRDRYDQWNDWIKQQNWMIKSATFIATAMVVIITIWLINGYGLINGLFDLHLDWLQSPLVR